jgi:membrane-bound serine protease (ClpP class)
VHGHNGGVILLTGILIGFFVVPDEWTAPVILGAAVLEVAETAVTWWWSRRHPPKVGPETLIGATARVVEACHPLGTVRVRGEIWQARCEAGANPDEIVTVVTREGLVLVVEQSVAAGLS